MSVRMDGTGIATVSEPSTSVPPSCPESPLPHAHEPVVSDCSVCCSPCCSPRPGSSWAPSPLPPWSGAFHLNRAASDAPAIAPAFPFRKDRPAAASQHLSIETTENPLILVMTEDEIGAGGGVNRFDPASPLFAGLAATARPAQCVKACPAGIAPESASLAGPLGSGHTPATGPLPNDCRKCRPAARPAPLSAGGPTPPPAMTNRTASRAARRSRKNPASVEL